MATQEQRIRGMLVNRIYARINGESTLAERMNAAPGAVDPYESTVAKLAAKWTDYSREEVQAGVAAIAIEDLMGD